MIMKPSNLTLDKFLLNYLNWINEQVESSVSKSRFETIIQMCRRYRGLTPSDLFGYWHNGVWAESPRFANLHGTNIFQALINGAAAAFLQSELSLDITAKSNTFEARAIEKISRGIYEVLNREWKKFEHEIFFGMILKLNAFCLSIYDKNEVGHVIQIPEFSNEQVQTPGRFVCQECGNTMEEIEAPQVCNECGSSNFVEVEQPGIVDTTKISGYKELTFGKIKTVITDALDLSLDDFHSNMDITKSVWAQWRYLASKSKLKTYYPDKDFNKITPWSYPTRLKMAYKKGSYLSGFPASGFEKNLLEVKHNWLEPCEYSDYISPSDYQLGDFSLFAGQPLTDVCPDGLVFITVGNEIIFIGPEDKKRVIKTCKWLEDPNSVYGIGAKAGLAIQKKINQLDNMAMEGESRSMKGSIIYAPEAVDGSYLEGANTNIPLKPDFALGGNRVSDFVFPIQVSGLSHASLTFLQNQIQTMQKILGIPDVLLGAGDKNIDTATGQQLVTERAAGLMVPPKLSEGQMKIGWIKDQLYLIQKYGDPSFIRKFGGKYDDNWTDDEVNAFLSNDFEEFISIELVSGTEIPESKSMRQMKFRNDIASGFIQMTPKVRARLLQQSGFIDLDVDGYSLNERLAEKRLSVILELVRDEEFMKNYEQAELALTDPETGRKMLNENGMEVINPVLNSILSYPVMEISGQAESHEIMIQFWSDKYKIYKSSMTEYPKALFDFMDYMISQHKAKAAEEMMKTQGLMSMGQMFNQMVAPREKPGPKPA